MNLLLMQRVFIEGWGDFRSEADDIGRGETLDQETSE